VTCFFRCALLTSALALSACSVVRDGHKATEASALTVRVTRAQQLSWPRRLVANGAFAPWQEMVISAETGPYRIASIEADVGTRARKGQVLATLSQANLRAEQARLVAQVGEARANLGKANSDVERARQVGNSGALSAQSIESYRVAQQTAQASLASAQAQLLGNAVSLGQTAVRAADDGIVFSRTAVLGKVVNAGDELFRLVRQGRIEWQAELDAQKLATVVPGQTARVTLPGGQVVEGKVRLVAPSFNGNTARGIAYVALPAQSLAKAGMYGSGTIEVGNDSALTVPDSAVVLRDGRSYVFVIHGNIARQTAVTTGQRQSGRVAISGVSTDAELVEAGGAFLSDGVPVRVLGAGK